MIGGMDDPRPHPSPDVAVAAEPSRPSPPARAGSRWTLRALWAGLALVLVTGVVALDATLTFLAATRRVEATLVNIERLNALLSLLKDAETGQRGYLLTGDERYLEPYQDAVAALWERQRELRVGLADRPRQRERLDALQPLVAAKLEGLHRTIELRRGGDADAAIRLVRTGEGRMQMDRIREAIGVMVASERGRHDARREGGEALWVLAAIGTGSAASLALVGAALSAMRRQARSRRREDAVGPGEAS